MHRRRRFSGQRPLAWVGQEYRIHSANWAASGIQIACINLNYDLKVIKQTQIIAHVYIFFVIKIKTHSFFVITNLARKSVGACQSVLF